MGTIILKSAETSPNSGLVDIAIIGLFALIASYYFYSKRSKTK